MSRDRAFALVLTAPDTELAPVREDMRLAVDLAFLSLVVSSAADHHLLLALARRAAADGTTDYATAVHALADVIRQQGAVALGSLLNIARSTL